VRRCARGDGREAALFSLPDGTKRRGKWIILRYDMATFGSWDARCGAGRWHGRGVSLIVGRIRRGLQGARRGTQRQDRLSRRRTGTCSTFDGRCGTARRLADLRAKRHLKRYVTNHKTQSARCSMCICKCKRERIEHEQKSPRKTKQTQQSENDERSWCDTHCGNPCDSLNETGV
jgi:hypothetical protein